MIGVDSLLYASDYPHDHGPSGDRLLSALDEPSNTAVLSGTPPRCIASERDEVE